jgi:hypothetical protein
MVNVGPGWLIRPLGVFAGESALQDAATSKSSASAEQDNTGQNEAGQNNAGQNNAGQNKARRGGLILSAPVAIVIAFNS